MRQAVVARGADVGPRQLQAHSADYDDGAGAHREAPVSERNATELTADSPEIDRLHSAQHMIDWGLVVPIDGSVADLGESRACERYSRIPPPSQRFAAAWSSSSSGTNTLSLLPRPMWSGSFAKSPCESSMLGKQSRQGALSHSGWAAGTRLPGFFEAEPARNHREAAHRARQQPSPSLGDTATGSSDPRASSCGPLRPTPSNPQRQPSCRRAP
jgi:hypothetical protein